MEEYVKGTCPYMCPIMEAKLRESRKLLHLFEMVPGTERNPIPKVDLEKAVKAFSRSAAGRLLTDPTSLRSISVLLETVNYLLDDIVSKDAEWLFKYNFISDRLRAVRQDMVIQNLSRAHQIVLLQPIIRFYAYAAYRSCEENISDFDPHINNSHLQECIKRLLSMYDYYDYLEKITKVKVGSNNFLEENRPYMESLYLLFNLGGVNAMNRILNIPRYHRRSTLLVTALKISFSYISGNYFKVCKLIKTLPISLKIITYLHMPEIRRSCFGIMAVSYNSKNLYFPTKELSELLLYNSVSELESDCVHYGLTVNENGIKFIKNDFKQVPKVKPRKSEEIDKELNNKDLSNFLLYAT